MWPYYLSAIARATADRLDAQTPGGLGTGCGDTPALPAGTDTGGPATAQRNHKAAVEPRGELASRTLAMPADANPSGDIFGGWTMARMDAAAAMTATRQAESRVVTVAVSNIAFLEPVHVGDTVCC